MGDPGTPTPADRAATRALAKEIIDDVREDIDPPHPFTHAPLDAVSAVMSLAQEIEMLTKESARLFNALDEALTLADVPERDQDAAWQARREVLGKVCDDHVGFKGSSTLTKPSCQCAECAARER